MTSEYFNGRAPHSLTANGERTSREKRYFQCHTKNRLITAGVNLDDYAPLSTVVPSSSIVAPLSFGYSQSAICDVK